MDISNHHRRSDAVFLFFFVFLFICIARLLFIQIFRSGHLADLAKKQHNLSVELEPRRGIIYDTNLKPQAINISVDSLYAMPSEIRNRDKESIIVELSPILKVEEAYLRKRLYRDKSFVWLARKLTLEQSESVKRLNLKGIGFIKENKRCYPNGYLASHVVGFAGLDNIGLEGTELFFDKYLRGEPGWALILRDARQQKLDISEKIVYPRDGYDLILTIDEVIQYIAEREIDKVFKTYHAKGASIVVMDPHTGAILALANRPTFDLNEYAGAGLDTRRNRSICDMFEPGSVFKIVTASAALEENKVSEEDKFFCENGTYKISSHTLHDHRSHGWLTFREVMEQSSNIGVTKVAQMLGAEAVYRYIRLFGFGSKSGIDLPGEITGVVKEPRLWSKISIAAIPIGQEVGVNVLQLARSLAVIANGGNLVKPYIVKEIRDKYKETIKKFSPEVADKVISSETAGRVKKILEGVVENGTGKMAKIPDFKTGGKTGTAQKLEPNGTYSHSKFIASFMGFAPVENPGIVIVVCVDEPRPAYFGGVVAAPVFRNVARDVLKYMKMNQLPAEVLKSDETKRFN